MVMTDFSPLFFVQLCNYLKSANRKVPDDCHLSDSLFFTAIIMWWTLHLSNYSPPPELYTLVQSATMLPILRIRKGKSSSSSMRISWHLCKEERCKQACFNSGVHEVCFTISYNGQWLQKHGWLQPNVVKLQESRLTLETLISSPSTLNTVFVWYSNDSSVERRA